jgi:hypothetical protein
MARSGEEGDVTLDRRFVEVPLQMARLETLPAPVQRVPRLGLPDVRYFR